MSLALRRALESSLSHTPCKAVQLLESHGTLIAQIVFFVKQEGFMAVGGIHFLQENIKF